MKKITRASGGTEEREVEVNKIEVPDMWHLAMWLQDLERAKLKQDKASDFDDVDMLHEAESKIEQLVRNMGNPKQVSEKLLECWHLAHDMKQALND